MAFCGWGSPQLPMDVTEINDWFRATEEDHDKVPEWLYELTDMLVKSDAGVEMDAGRYRKRYRFLLEESRQLTS